MAYTKRTKNTGSFVKIVKDSADFTERLINTSTHSERDKNETVYTELSAQPTAFDERDKNSTTFNELAVNVNTFNERDKNTAIHSLGFSFLVDENKIFIVTDKYERILLGRATSVEPENNTFTELSKNSSIWTDR